MEREIGECSLLLLHPLLVCYMESIKILQWVLILTKVFKYAKLKW